jgi:hypothetical protein
MVRQGDADGAAERAQMAGGLRGGAQQGDGVGGVQEGLDLADVLGDRLVDAQQPGAALRQAQSGRARDGGGLAGRARGARRGEAAGGEEVGQAIDVLHGAVEAGVEQGDDGQEMGGGGAQAGHAAGELLPHAFEDAGEPVSEGSGGAGAMHVLVLYDN